ncbi:HD domain-containing protein [Amycolatopsis sp. 195334CR]|uniref:HD domain-containing protein n=1 Tax=Amycolatopsis sp. 195334CR TaxID=2814588 RepID=UPI001A8C2EB1|nr:HD domain-containing protein [Amycolatopsis sp. 195334CR]MBN6036240.1 HD domain-containing protein [Amycolatopsis sp. 195334CR]
MSATIERAMETGREFTYPLGRRWLHVQAVAQAAHRLSIAIPEPARNDLVSAAWLHDIGYSPKIGHTGFHPLDGARYLQAHGWPNAVVNLVAHHSGARFEAKERNLSKELSVFLFEDTPALDALVTADLTTGPNGERLTYDERIAEILERYLPEDPVHRTWVKAAPILKEAVQRTEERLAKAQPR